MSRLVMVCVLGGAGVLLTPPAASAQFVRPWGLPGGFRLVPPVRLVPTVPLVPIVRPVPIIPPVIGFPQFRYSWNTQFDLRTSFGSVSYRYTQLYVGPGRPGQFFYVAAPLSQRGYMFDGVVGPNNVVLTEQENLARAQRLATATANLSPGSSSRTPIPLVTVPATGPLPLDAAGQALAPAKPEEIASGEALNRVMREIARAEEQRKDRDAKVPSAYLPPQLLRDLRFAGSPAADLLDVARTGRLELPAAFDAAALASPRVALTREFAAAVEPLRAGKLPDATQAGRAEAALQAFEAAAEPVLKERPAAEAAEGRQFLERAGRAVAALKDASVKGLIDPTWESEGLTGAELVRHMTKYNLAFGPAPRGEAEGYDTVYNNLTTYLYALSQQKKR